jgi:hypothetical protein
MPSMCSFRQVPLFFVWCNQTTYILDSCIFYYVRFSMSCYRNSTLFLFICFQNSANQGNPKLQATSHAQTITSVYFIFLWWKLLWVSCSRVSYFSPLCQHIYGVNWWLNFTNIYRDIRCCCWMWMATVCCLREHRLLLHRRRSPWCCSRFCLQARRKGGGFSYELLIHIWYRYLQIYALNICFMVCLPAGHLGWHDWRYGHADGHSAMGHHQNWLEQRGTCY